MQTIPYRDEHHYGQLMRLKAKLEGQVSRVPSNENSMQVNTAQQAWRRKILSYFEKNPDPIYRVELSKILKIEADTLRRVCRSLVVAGYLSARRTQTGVVYHPPSQ